MKEEKKEVLFKCFCEARRTQAYFSTCLDADATEEERHLIVELVEDYTKTSNKIMDFCSKINQY